MKLYDAMKQGMSEEELRAQFEKDLAKAQREIAEEEAKAKAEKEKLECSALRTEARQYLINAVLAYSELYNIQTEWTQEDLDELESTIAQLEDMMPKLIKMAELMEQIKGEEKDGLGNIFGMFM